LDEVRKNVDNLEGTLMLSQDATLESDANIFSAKLSEYRDDHVVKMAERIQEARQKHPRYKAKTNQK
jgi:hypothetical protein